MGSVLYDASSSCWQVMFFLFFYSYFQLSYVMLADLRQKIHSEVESFGTYLETTILEGLRTELAARQTRLLDDYTIALNAMAALKPYFPRDHFRSRINNLLIWRRPLLSISDGQISVRYTINRDDIPDDRCQNLSICHATIAEHMAAYFEKMYEKLNDIADINLKLSSDLNNILVYLTAIMEEFRHSAAVDANYIKYVLHLFTKYMIVKCLLNVTVINEW